LGTCTPSIPVTDLGVGAKVTCSASHVLTKTDGDNGSFANTASVTDNTVCPAAGTSVCDSKVTVTVTPPGVAGILVEKSVTNVTFVGVSVINMTYQIKVTNTGTVTLSNVQVVDDLKLTYPSPATFTVKQVTSPVFQVNTGYNGDSKTNLLKGTDSLASGAFGTISLTVQVNTGGDAKNYTNTAVGSGLPPVGSKVEGTGTATGPKYIDPAITKAVDPTQAAVGDTVTFTLTVTNNGNWPATGVVVQDPLPGIFDYVSATSIDANTSLPRGTVSLITPRTVRVAIGNLAVTDKIIITITTKVNSLGQPPIENKATVSADPPPSGVSPDPIANDSSAVNITIGSNTTSLPSTGFAPNMTTVLAPQPADKAYSNNGDVWIEIPRLGISMPVVGVPHVNGSWDVSWLNNQAGWLQGTAFPSWSGNSVLTGHVYLANGQPGPFVNLSSLRWGDQIIAHIYGVSYVYEVRNNQVLSLNDTSVLSHKDVPWMTLLTCKDFDPATNSYLHRVAISAVLIDNSTSVDRSDR
jgi:LPXTG-site transpeptidase (sortase) family protein